MDQDRPHRPQDQQQQEQQPKDSKHAEGSKQGGDQGKVGQDTDGDGKVVKPGQPPNQSHGKGLK